MHFGPDRIPDRFDRFGTPAAKTLVSAQNRTGSLQAHRLLAWVQMRGEDVRPLVNHLFAAQFQQGLHIGDRQVLTTIAVNCGQDRNTIAAFLAGDELTRQVRDEEREYRQKGISMVPSFVIDGQKLVVGAEDPSILATALLTP